MESELLTYTTKMLKLLTEHIQTCKSHNCCVRDFADNLDFEKNNMRTLDPHKSEQTPDNQTTVDLDRWIVTIHTL